jgi:hypothetical protein
VRAFVVAMLLACSALTAHAESDDTTHFYIVVVGDDPEFVSALELVMEGNNTGVKAIGERPTPALAELGPESRRLADGNQAIATVWLSPTAAGATLVTYDRSVDRFVVREVPYKLPLQQTQAFETARMVRVMLRAVRDRNDEGGLGRGLRSKHPTVEEPRFSASAGGGAWLATPEATAKAMATIALAWRPRGLGVAASAMLAPATELDLPAFQGDVSVWRVAIEARKALPLPRGVYLTPALGISLHHVTVEGTTGAIDTIDTRRFNPALTVGALVGTALPHRVELALALGADCLLRRQRYATETQEILSIPRIQVMMGVLVGIRL